MAILPSKYKCKGIKRRLNDPVGIGKILGIEDDKLILKKKYYSKEDDRWVAHDNSLSIKIDRIENMTNEYSYGDDKISLFEEKLSKVAYICAVVSIVAILLVYLYYKPLVNKQQEEIDSKISSMTAVDEAIGIGKDISSLLTGSEKSEIQQLKDAQKKTVYKIEILSECFGLFLVLAGVTFLISCIVHRVQSKHGEPLIIFKTAQGSYGCIGDASHYYSVVKKWKRYYDKGSFK